MADAPLHHQRAARRSRSPTGGSVSGVGGHHLRHRRVERQALGHHLARQIAGGDDADKRVVRRVTQSDETRASRILRGGILRRSCRARRSRARRHQSRRPGWWPGRCRCGARPRASGRRTARRPRGLPSAREIARPAAAAASGRPRRAPRSPRWPSRSRPRSPKELRGPAPRRLTTTSFSSAISTAPS